jgi:hypothetical protein
MAKRVLIAAVAGVLGASFRRLGHDWPKTGRVVDATDFSQADWDVLVAEPMLHIGPAPTDAAEEDLTLRDAVKAALGKLSPEDFTDGLPNLAAVKKAVGGKAAKNITADLVAEVLAGAQSAA